MTWQHIPVLLNEVIDGLKLDSARVGLDCTVGLGGHTEAILQSAPKLEKLVALDQDPAALEIAQQRIAKLPNSLNQKVQFIQANFGQIANNLIVTQTKPFDFILMDLGVSSMQLDDPERGFSFGQDAPLDMRMDPQKTVSAFTIINTWQEDALARLIWQYGEESRSRQIARAICQTRKHNQIGTTGELANLIKTVYPFAGLKQKTHPATKTFQAIRIEVNQEMEMLRDGIEAGLKILNQGGRLGVISFHSLEDRVVKRLFQDALEKDYRLITKKPLVASEQEINQNARSRSAKLRIIERTSQAN